MLCYHMVSPRTKTRNLSKKEEEVGEQARKGEEGSLGNVLLSLGWGKRGRSYDVQQFLMRFAMQIMLSLRLHLDILYLWFLPVLTALSTAISHI